MTISHQESLDSNDTYSSKSDIEKYLKREYYGYDVEDVIVTITEFTTIEGEKAYYLTTSIADQVKDLFWHYEKYGTEHDSHLFELNKNIFDRAFDNLKQFNSSKNDIISKIKTFLNEFIEYISNNTQLIIDSKK